MHPCLPDVSSSCKRGAEPNLSSLRERSLWGLSHRLRGRTASRNYNSTNLANRIFMMLRRGGIETTFEMGFLTMLKLPHPLEIEVAQQRIRQAVHAYSRSPTETNEKRVNMAMQLWREINTQRLVGRRSARLANEARTRRLRGPSKIGKVPRLDRPMEGVRSQR